MGRVSEAIADAAREYGAEIVTDATVAAILTHDDKPSSTSSHSKSSNSSNRSGPPGEACGVTLTDGTTVHAAAVVAACAPTHALLELLPPAALPPAAHRRVRLTGSG